MSIADEKYVALMTFRRTGEPVTSPVWIVPLGDGRAGVITGSTTGKVKRLAHTSRVALQPCDARGRLRPGSAPVAATAAVVGPDDPALDRTTRGVRRKYRLLGPGLQAVGALRRLLPGGRAGIGDRAVVIGLDDRVGTG